MSMEQSHKGFCVLCGSPINSKVESVIREGELYCYDCASEIDIQNEKGNDNDSRISSEAERD